MRFSKPLLEGKFLERLNRFAARVTMRGETVLAHVPNSGRLGELLRPGARVYLVAAAGCGRVTAYDLMLAELDGAFVAVDARQPPGLLIEALLEGVVPELGFPNKVESEVGYGSSRLDLAWEEEGGRRVLLEAKSVTLVQNGVALFPDAPTSRGRRHLEELAVAVGEGYRGLVAFVIQRSDPIAFRANAATDPAFASALEKAGAAGVEVYAYSCQVTLSGVSLWRQVPVIGTSLVSSG